MRRGELLRLIVSDYDSKEGALLIRESKFHKSRILPLHKDMANEINRYLQLRREHHLPMSPETPLLWNRRGGGESYTGSGLGKNVRILFNLCAIRTAKGNPPRIHDFRQHAESRIMPNLFQIRRLEGLGPFSRSA